jgi:putative phosphoesterase
MNAVENCQNFLEVIFRMKVGIISDIHGDLSRLNAAVEVLNNKNVDIILCAGDLIDFGNNSIGVVERILNLRIPCVYGNHDKSAVQNQSLRKEQLARGMDVQILDEKTLQSLSMLPQKLLFEWEQTTVLITHANPWGLDSMYIQPDSTPHLLKRVMKDASTDIVILGHTHQPMCVEIMRGMILNPGSVSNNYEFQFGTCGLLDLPERSYQVLNIETGNPIDNYHRIQIAS